MQFGANFSSFLLPPALVAVPASTLLYQTAPRGAGTEAGPAAQAHLEHCSLDRWMVGPPSMAGSTPGQGPANPALGVTTLPGRDPFSWPSAAVTEHHPERDLCVVPVDPVPAVLALLSWCVQS